MKHLGILSGIANLAKHTHFPSKSPSSLETFHVADILVVMDLNLATSYSPNQVLQHRIITLIYCLSMPNNLFHSLSLGSIYLILLFSFVFFYINFCT